MIVSRSPKKKKITVRSQMNPINEDLIKVIEISKKHDRHIQFIVNAIKRLPSILSLFKQGKASEVSSLKILNQFIYSHSSNQVSPRKHKSPKKVIKVIPSADSKDGDLSPSFSNNSIQEILKFISKEMVLQYKDSESIFLKYGDDCSDYMYLILKGEAAVLSTIIKYSYLTEEDLLKYFMHLRMRDEYSLLQLTYYENYPLFEKFLHHIHPSLDHQKLHNPHHNQHDKAGSRASNAHRISMFFTNTTISYKETSVQFCEYFDKWILSVFFKVECELIVLKEYFNDLLSSRNIEGPITEENLTKLHKTMGDAQDLNRILKAHSIEIGNIRFKSSNNYFDSKYIDKLRDFAFILDDPNCHVNHISNKTRKSLLKEFIQLKFELLNPNEEIDLVNCNLDDYISSFNEFFKEKNHNHHHESLFKKPDVSPPRKLEGEGSSEKLNKESSKNTRGSISGAGIKSIFKHGQKTMFSIHPMSMEFHTEKDVENDDDEEEIVEDPESVLAQKIFLDSIPIVNKESLLMNDCNFHLLNNRPPEKKGGIRGIFEAAPKEVSKPQGNKPLPLLIDNAADLLDYQAISLHFIMSRTGSESKRNIKQLGSIIHRSSTSNICLEERPERSNLHSHTLTPTHTNSGELHSQKFKLVTYQYAHHKVVGEKIGLMNSKFEDSKYKSDFCIIFSQKTVLGLINKQKYFNFVEYLNSKLNVEDIKFFIKSPLFIGLSHEQFYKKYFKLFQFEIMLRDELLNNHKHSKYFFIKKGRVSISYEGTLRELLGLIKQNVQNFNKTEQELYYNLVNSKGISCEFSDIITKSSNWEETMFFIDRYYDEEFKAYLDKPIKSVIQNIDCNFSLIVAESFLKYNTSTHELKILCVSTRMEGYSLSLKDMSYITDGEIDVRKRLRTFKGEFFAATFKKLINLRDRLLENLFEERNYIKGFNKELEIRRKELLSTQVEVKNKCCLQINCQDAECLQIQPSMSYCNIFQSSEERVLTFNKHLAINEYEKAHHIFSSKHRPEDLGSLVMFSTATPITSKNAMMTSKSSLSTFKNHSVKSSFGNIKVKQQVTSNLAKLDNFSLSNATFDALITTKARNSKYLMYTRDDDTCTNPIDRTDSKNPYIINLKKSNCNSGLNGFIKSVPNNKLIDKGKEPLKHGLISNLSQSQAFKLSMQMPWSLVHEQDSLKEKEREQKELKREIERMLTKSGSLQPKNSMSKENSLAYNKDDVSRYNYFVRNFQKSSKLKSSNFTARFLSNSGSIASIVTRAEKIKNLILNN